MISIHVFCSGNSNYVVYLCTFREFKCVLKCISRLLGRMVNKWTPLNSFYEYFGRKLLFGSFLDWHPQLLTESFHFHHEYSGQWVWGAECQNTDVPDVPHTKTIPAKSYFTLGAQLEAWSVSIQKYILIYSH